MSAERELPSVVISYRYERGDGIEHRALRSGADAESFIIDSPLRGRVVTAIRIYEP